MKSREHQKSLIAKRIELENEGNDPVDDPNLNNWLNWLTHCRWWLALDILFVPGLSSSTYP